MISFRKIPGLLTTIFALMLGTSAGRAGLGGIQDGGAFFSEHARVEASRIIGDVERTLKKDIVIETFAAIPDAVKNGENLADKAAAGRFFEQWAEKQARDQRVTGIYILLVKQPAYLHAIVGNQTLKQTFTAADRDALVSTMRTKLHAKQNDAALLEGVGFISSTMRAHAAGHAAPVQRSDARPAATGSSTGWILPVVIGLLLAWVVFGLLRSLFNRGSAGGAGMPQGAGGGGFFSSLIGGMFGAAAGMWMYDQFFSSHGNAADRNDATGGADGGASGQDTDYSGSGGGFGDDSDSGSGGGDSGGGFGGGDSGGGGDF